MYSNSQLIYALIIVTLVALIIYNRKPSNTCRIREGVAFDDLPMVISGSEEASQRSRGVTTSIMERRGDQTAFGKVASRQKSKNSQFEQTVSQAALFGDA